MKKKNKKRKYIPFKKTIIPVLSILMIIVAVFIVMYTIDNKKFNNRHKVYSNDYLFLVKFITVDKKMTKENDNYEDILLHNSDSLLLTFSEVIPLTKDGDYLYADLNNFANKVLLEDEISLTFAYNNFEGHVLEDCEYDKKTNKIKIPYSYYKESDALVPLQFEVVSRIDEKNLSNSKYNLTVKKVFTHNKKENANSYLLKTEIPLKNYSLFNIPKESIHLYINGGSTVVNSDNFDYDADTKTVSINMPAMLINSIDVKIDTKLFGSANAAIYTKAVGPKTPDEMHAIKIKKPVSWLKTKNYVTQITMTYTYATSGSNTGNLQYCGNISSACYDLNNNSNGYEETWDHDHATYYYTYIDPDTKDVSGTLDNNPAYDRSINRMYYNVYPTSSSDDAINGYVTPFPYRIKISALLSEMGVSKDSDYTIQSYGSNTTYMALGCIHTSVPATLDTGDTDINLKVLHVGDNYAVLSLFMVEENGYNQAGFGYFKVEWDEVGLRVKKVDDSDPAIPVKGLKITAVNIDPNSTEEYTATTNSSGIATFDDLTKGEKYKFYEDCNSNVTYDGQSGTLDDFDIHCVYGDRDHALDNSGNGYSPKVDYQTDSAALKTMKNIKYRYCAKVHKVKGTDKRNEPDVTFKLTIAKNVCAVSKDNAYTVSKTTSANGLASFVGLGNCAKGSKGTIEVTDPVHAASIIGDNPRNITLVKSRIRSKVDNFKYKGNTFDTGDTIPAMLQSDLTTYINDGKVEEICPTADAVEFRDKDYVLIWTKKDYTYRVNNDGKILSNVEFTVNQGNTTIRVEKTKQNYTDADTNGVTKSCYKYTTSTDESTTTTILKSDSNGETCIFNLPAEDILYTVTERPTTIYNHEPITIPSKTRYAEVTNNDYKNYEYLIDWDKKEFKNDKTSNSNGKLVNAKFTVTTTSNVAVKTKPTKETVYDKSGTESRSCYVVDLFNSSNNTNSVFESDSDGYVCIVGLEKDTTYRITETKPSKYYAYADVKTINEDSKLLFNTSTTNPKTVYQCPTEVKITKTTTELNSSSDEEKKLIYEELQKLTFNILDSNENVLRFKWNSATKHYEYQVAVNDLTGSTDQGITEIRLLNGVNVASTSLSNMDLNIFVNYLPEGTYTLREVSSVSCGKTSDSATEGSNCTCAGNTSNPGQATTEEASCSNMGYGHVDDITFTVTDTNNGNSLTCDKEDNSVKISLTNKPTEVKFTKKDFYTYYNNVDTVKFETDEEIEAFDNITFKVRKKSTTNLSGISSTDSSVYEWFYKTADGVYRHDVLHKCTREGQQVAGYTCTQNLHTDRGDMKLTHLCKCEDYYIEEYEVPDGSVFILPKLEGDSCREGYMKVNKDGKLECHPIKGIKVCDCDDDNPESSPPVKIEDIPTKQVFIKKDLKYNTIITDQTTTFELYLTSEEAYVAGRSCNPYDPTSKASDCIQIGFSKYEVLQSTDIDEEDGISHSYIMSTNPSENDIKDIKVDPRTGKIIFRYLPSFTQYADREYVLMETVAPVGYDLPKEEKSVTRFKVANDTVNVEVSNVPNKPSKAIIGKYDIATGKLIPGVKFKVYKVNNYDENLTAMMQSKSPVLEFKTIRDGSYEYREVFDTDTITTCIDKEGSPCSDISSTLVENTYAGTDMGIQESTTTIQEGQALIQYLDTNTYYVIEEVEAPEGYSLPERESDRFTLFYIPESEEVTEETKIYNTETYFTFFKYDEFNRVKDGATFKLQKLNKDKIYEDVAVEDVSTEDTKMYRVLSTSENYDITTLNGQATIYRLTEGQYRIIETKAPEGYELPKKTYNVVTFLVDKKGHTYGQNIIANKKKTEHIEVVPEAEAELVVNIQTGKTVIKYGLIIAGILGLVSLLIYIRKKVSK